MPGGVACSKTGKQQWLREVKIFKVYKLKLI